MVIGNMINKLRTEAKLTQEGFADIFGVAQQSVQKWESGQSVPDLEKLVAISKHFDISLDMLILGNDGRTVEEMSGIKHIRPRYRDIPQWESYPSNLLTEYTQSLEEGLDIESYKEVFASVALLPAGEIKEAFGNILFDVVSSSKMREGYEFTEPSDLEGIKMLRNKSFDTSVSACSYSEDKLMGAWMGRVCGCMLGKSVEGIRTNELIPFLRETDNYPMHRYILRSDIKDEIVGKYKFGFKRRRYADEIDGMPVDDDTNYVIMAQEIVKKYGRDFTPKDISIAWQELQSKYAYCTAERVAFCNFVKGYQPPESAVYKNPYREWIGAQIRGDYFGYINPGDPEKAAEMAWRDASISHVKNGIYGEMFAAAMIAVAAATNDIGEIIRGGLAEIPCTSRLYRDVMWVLDGFEKGMTAEECFKTIHEKYDEYTEHGWCHTISNAMIVAAALLYGGGDFGRSICMAVETGFDTDCNGATVGSVLGMANGIDSIPEYWTEPINDTLHTSIFGVGTVKISERVKMTTKHMK